uniref:Uncharacterized protein n=1 Tax=Trypanosoma congolense (strain IL3000) TaxID=1068625 RepID=G0UN69_TRYCI|nr:hypothetical protein, unlikely [Trypanosoma congolense IL3000]
MVACSFGKHNGESERISGCGKEKKSRKKGKDGDETQDVQRREAERERHAPLVIIKAPGECHLSLCFIFLVVVSRKPQENISFIAYHRLPTFVFVFLIGIRCGGYVVP